MTRCAFVNFQERSVAELAAQAWANGLEIDNERVGVKWGRSKAGSKPALNPPVLADIAVTA
jgi:pre-mRNA-splicing factor RBM22/SLT11